MTLTGFSLPELSAFDPTVEVKEASTQMGLAAIPDRLADLLVPGLRARMKRVRFVTASAVGDAGMRDPRQREPRRRYLHPSICFRMARPRAVVRRLPGAQGFPMWCPPA